MKSKTLLLTIVLLLLISNVVVAQVEDLNSLSKAIKDNASISDKLGTEGKTVLMGMSKSIFDIVRYIVISFILIKIFAMFMEFQDAADAPDKRASIKTKSMWGVIGLLFALNFWSIYEFATSILNKINLL